MGSAFQQEALSRFHWTREAETLHTSRRAPQLQWVSTALLRWRELCQRTAGENSPLCILKLEDRVGWEGNAEHFDTYHLCHRSQPSVLSLLKMMYSAGRIRKHLLVHLHSNPHSNPIRPPFLINQTHFFHETT